MAAICLAFVVVVVVVLSIFGGAGVLLADAKTEPKEVSIVFTSDVHSHLDSFVTVFEGEETNIGGFARLKTLIDGKRQENPDTLYLDGGDFSMGTLVQTVYEEQAAELRLLDVLGCDATTFGNHEFDYRSQGLANMLQTAMDSGEAPELVVCNIDWSNLNEEQQMLKDTFDAYGVTPYIMVQKGDVNIAITGVFGEDALACAPTCALTFEDPVEALQRTVAEIKKNEEADMIVCVSHSGTTEDEESSEDEIIAQEVPEIDFIVSGHSHTTLAEPIVYGDTYIGSCGEYGEMLGSITMTQKDNGRWQMDSYELIPVTEDVVADAQVQARIDAFMEAVDEEYLSQFGYTKDQVLVVNDVSFSTVEDCYGVHTEHNLGNIMADGFLYGARTAEGHEDEDYDIAIVPSGCIRDTYTKGEITVADVFKSYSLGIGPDGVPGYPLIKVYLSGEELKTAVEIDASLSEMMPSVKLYISGLHFSYNPNRMILNRVTDVKLVDSEGQEETIQDDRLYAVVADLYSAQMLGMVNDMSYGLLSIVPKDAEGNPVEDYETCIIYDGNQELKAWVAIAEYMDSFPENEDGISAVPERYAVSQGRKVVDDSTKIGDLLRNPSKYMVMIVMVLVVLIVVIVLLILLIRRVVRKHKKKKA